MSIILALIGYGFQAVDSILNKFILEKTTVKPTLFLFYSTITALPVFLLLPFGTERLIGVMDYSVALCSGLMFAAALAAMYTAIQESEISHIGPLLGAVIPFFVLILSYFFLGEVIVTQVLVGIGILILGSLIIAFEKSRLHQGFHRGVMWGVLAGFFFAVSHVTAKYTYDVHGFLTGFVYTRGFSGLVGIVLLALPSIRRALFTAKQKTAPTKSLGQTSIVVIEKVVGFFGVVLLQYATAIGSVTIVNALAGAQFALLIGLVALLSKIRPAVFKEEYQGREIVQEIIGVIVIALGLILIIR